MTGTFHVQRDSFHWIYLSKMLRDIISLILLKCQLIGQNNFNVDSYNRHYENSPEMRPHFMQQTESEHHIRAVDCPQCVPSTKSVSSIGSEPLRSGAVEMPLWCESQCPLNTAPRFQWIIEGTHRLDEVRLQQTALIGSIDFFSLYFCSIRTFQRMLHRHNYGIFICTRTDVHSHLIMHVCLNQFRHSRLLFSS